MKLKNTETGMLTEIEGMVPGTITITPFNMNGIAEKSLFLNNCNVSFAGRIVVIAGYKTLDTFGKCRLVSFSFEV